MGSKGVSFLLLAALVLCHGVLLTMAMANYEQGDKEWEQRSERSEEEEGEGGGQEEEWFLLPDSKRVMKTDAGEMRVVRSHAGRIIDQRPLHIGFITMEPKSLFIPQYLDSSLVLFVRRGEARLGCIYKDELVERRLKIGDVYRIPAGSTFYILNLEEGQRLHIICSIDPSESLQLDSPFQSFFIGGGTYPTSILSGFGPETLSTAFNVSASKLRGVLLQQKRGPFVYLTESHAPSLWTQLHDPHRLKQLKRLLIQDQSTHQQDKDIQQQTKWSWRSLFGSVFRSTEGEINWNNGNKKAPGSYNLYKASPDFKNNYGWSIAVEGSDYSPLKDSGVGVYLVNLTAGAMLAPHVNPRATEYGIVLRGSGRIQIVYPNGSLALDARVKEGDVFWVPRYFAFCQIASRSGPFEFFGFTTSAHKNRPQFLVGANSLLHTLNIPELAAAFGVRVEIVQRLINAQREAVILPSPAAAPPDEEEKQEEEEKKETKKKRVMNLGREILMGFD